MFERSFKRHLQGDNDLYKYVVYKPKGGDARVKAARVKLYIPGDEGLYAAIDTYLVDTTWVRTMSSKNDTDGAQQYNIEYNTELRITQGLEVCYVFSIANVYEGMSTTIERQEKVFKATETTRTKTISVNVTIPPRSRLIFYQRRYRFKNNMFFILDAWAKEWNVGSWGGYDASRKECIVEIFSEDYATLTSELDGSRIGTMDVETVTNVQGADTSRMREECTERCKETLARMGV